jgi:hypothetical protein
MSISSNLRSYQSDLPVGKHPLAAANPRMRRKSPALSCWLFIYCDFVNVVSNSIRVDWPPALCPLAQQRHINYMAHNWFAFGFAGSE